VSDELQDQLERSNTSDTESTFSEENIQRSGLRFGDASKLFSRFQRAVMPISMTTHSPVVQNQAEQTSQLDTAAVELAEMYGDIESPKLVLQDNPALQPEISNPVLDRFQRTVNAHQIHNVSAKIPGHDKSTVAHTQLSAATAFDPNLSMTRQYGMASRTTISALTSESLARHQQEANDEYKSSVFSPSSSGHLSVVSSVESLAEDSLLIRPAVFTKFSALHTPKTDAPDLQHMIIDIPDQAWTDEARQQIILEPFQQEVFPAQVHQIQAEEPPGISYSPVKKGAIVGAIVGVIPGVIRLNPVALIAWPLLGAGAGATVGIYVILARLRMGQA